MERKTNQQKVNCVHQKDAPDEAIWSLLHTKVISNFVCICMIRWSSKIVSGDMHHPRTYE